MLKYFYFARHGLCPIYSADLIQPPSIVIDRRSLQSASSGQYHRLRLRRVIGQRWLSYNRPHAWNALPVADWIGSKSRLFKEEIPQSTQIPHPQIPALTRILAVNCVSFPPAKLPLPHWAPRPRVWIKKSPFYNFCFNISKAGVTLYTASVKPLWQCLGEDHVIRKNFTGP